MPCEGGAGSRIGRTIEARRCAPRVLADKARLVAVAVPVPYTGVAASARGDPSAARTFGGLRCVSANRSRAIRFDLADVQLTVDRRGTGDLHLRKPATSISDPKVIRWHTSSFSYLGDLIDLDFSVCDVGDFATSCRFFFSSTCRP